MAKAKKYDYRLVQDKSGWSAEITRRASASKTIVSKSQGGFELEEDARQWAEEALQSFSQTLSDRNKRRAEKRN
jgi:Protein of unknown function (DUF3622)